MTLFILPLLLRPAMATTPSLWDLLVLHGNTLSRLHGTTSELVATIDFLPPAPAVITAIPAANVTPTSQAGVGVTLTGADGLYVWGSFGLGWVNMATHRATLLTADGPVSDVVRGGDWVVYRSAGKVKAWSTAAGHEVTVCPANCAAFAVSKMGAVAWNDNQTLHLATTPAMNATEGGAQVPSVTSAIPPFHGQTALAFAPDASRFVFVSGGSEDYGEANESVEDAKDGQDSGTDGSDVSGEADNPIVADWVMADGRALVHNELLPPGGYNWITLSWEPGAQLTLDVQSTETGDSYFIQGYSLIPATAPITTPTRATSAPIKVQRVQGRAELFTSIASQLRQVTDLSPIGPTPLSSDGQCTAANALGWLPWGDGRHVLVGELQEWCWLEPDWGGSVRAYLADLETSAAGQIDLGPGLWARGSDREPPESGAEASAAISWNLLGQYAPDRSALLTSSGLVLYADGSIVPERLVYDWAAWVPARGN